MKLALTITLLLICCTFAFAQGPPGFTPGPIDSVWARESAGKPLLVLRGDLNQNGWPYDVGDAVVYTNYFINGEKAFEPYVAEAIAASDIDGDHVAPSLADLVRLIRIIIGVEPGFGDYFWPLPPEQIEYTVDQGMLSTDEEVGAILIVYSGNVVPTNRSNLEMMTAFDGLNTRCLLYPRSNGVWGQATARDYIVYCNAPIISIEMATPEGAHVNGYSPGFEIALYQNIPNPFNPRTTIAFFLLQATSWEISVFDFLGRRVAHWEGRDEPGVHFIWWDAVDQPTGVYFCRLTASDTSVTRKMMLLK